MNSNWIYALSGRKRFKILKIMKLFTIFMLFFVLGATAGSYSQNQVVSLNLQQCNVRQLFKEIRKQTGLRFVFNEKHVVGVADFDVRTEQEKVEDVLEEVFGKTNLECRFENDVIFVVPRQMQQQTLKSVTVTGKVSDNKKQSLPGVTIMLKGTSLGTVTDADGKFRITLPQGEKMVLLFSFIGMKTVELNYTGQKELNVVMQEDATEMEEVVVTGIFERKAESFTGSVATYRGEELKKVGTQNILQSLKTLDPSFRITPNNQFGSDPNKLPDVNIRGKSSISNIESEWGEDPNRPLFILDGFEVDLQTVVDLSMDRIASVNILKDAASTAMYGSRAANGVMVIETVKPQAGKLQFFYNGSLNVEMPDLSDYNMMNAEEKLAFEKAAGFYERSYVVSVLQAKEALYNQRLATVRSGVDSYWLSEGLRTGLTHKHNVRATGGDKTMYYSFGLNYMGNNGVMEGSGRNVLGANINLQYRIDKFQVSNDFTFDYTEAENPPVSFSEYARVNPYYQKEIIPEHPQYFEVYMIDGFTYRRVNPLYNASLTHKNESKSTGFRNNLNIEYRPVNSLRLNGKFHVSKTDGKTEVYKSPNHTDFDDVAQAERGSFTKSTSSNVTYNGNFSVTYGKNFNETHMLNVVGRWEFSSTQRYSDSYYAIGFPTDRLSNPAFAISYPTSGKPGYGENLSRSINFMATAGYGYKERYLIDATIRRDGSTNFGRNNLWTNTWSVGLAWNIHKEEFMGEWADLLKVRMAYGNPGNNSQSYDTYLSYTYNTRYQNVFGLGAQLGAFGNKNLDWQKTRDLTLGLELSVFHRRLSLVFDYYQKITDPLIIQINVAPSTGKAEYVTNLGRNTIKGLTFDLKARLLENKEKNFSWNLSLHGYHETTKYSRIGNSLDNFNKKLMSSSLYRYRDGGSSYDIWTVRSAGIDPMSGKEIYIRKDGSYTFTYDASDEVVCGNTAPELEGVLGTTLYWKGLSFSAYFRYSLGGDYFNGELFQRIENIGRETDQYNQDKRAYYDRWKQVGDRSKYRDITSISDGHKSDRYIQKNNFFTGESIAVGYQFHEHAWLKKLGLRNLTVNATLNEIFRCSTVKAERGIDYPFARTMSISLNASF